jgi:predicted RNA-binding Zn ribbon-like protein
MEVAEKRSQFLWLANWPALDFVNTQIVQTGETIDLLTTGDDLARWLTQVGLVDRVDLSGAKLQAALEAARTYRGNLRTGLEHLVKTKRGGLPPLTIASTNAFLQRHNLGFQLQMIDKTFRLTTAWILRQSEDLCAPIALSFAQLLSTADLRRIRRCKNTSCILYFYDTSKSATRQWCSLDICGNKQRVAAFRARRSRQDVAF